ncbi:hypothetical protein BU24DRAFT_400747 [Aaosphaeria arxii CBS 175.79]|uniref:Uncharacterized protein n=1 Tax=Aaosphaeria arxii CBS 175.79 TaxID=1450172 RepID=A0A6A5XBA4_9PLEO|nr:uncharacterized protein BU24DRAFT_400747 [Aaosphaeria arxii CBS 175.79]KAF2010077.1 hypothetical protein BU24DRAFT_400747 [Aaosphaeria arxii CBS 175.79]
MPLPKRPTLPTKAKSSEEGARKKDTRFSNFQTDAKFRLPSKKNTKTKLDSRFSRLLDDPEFYNKASVDRYGRKVGKDAGKKKLEKFYRQDQEEDDDEDDDEEEDEEDLKDGKASKREKNVKKQLAKADIRGQNYDPIRDGGLSSSSDESSSDDDSEDEEVEAEEEVELAGENEDIPTGDVTSRLAAVNLDWDNIRAADIVAVAGSFVPSDGRLLSVVIYPSEFGRERMEREELEGPPKEIFAASSKSKDDTTLNDDSDSDASEDDEQIKKQLLEESTGDEFDSKALRAYQLDRLRYYYAVITCSSPNVAKSIYDNLDGREYLSSANFFDLRFIPDDTTFDEEPHDECSELPSGYKPNEFTTGALSHSKVTLTWDADDRQRQEAQKRAFSRDELDENELKAYLGSDGDSDDDEEEDAPRPDKAAALRKALGLGSADEPSKASKRESKHPGGEMQVTFSAALSTKGQGGSVFENEPIVEETTLERYKRKQKERKQRGKERAKAIREGRDPDAEAKEAKNAVASKANDDGDAAEDDPWNDPFFASDPEDVEAAERKSKKAEKARKRKEQEQDEEAAAAEKANLELLMVDDEGNKVQHFDMNEIAKAEKAKKKGKKGKKSKDAAAAAVVEDDFEMNTQDPRFAKLYDSHEFAIDPTNPRFKGTQGMKALLEEGRKKRRHDRDDGEDLESQQSRAKKSKKDAGAGAGDNADDLKKLAERVKAKSRR